MSLIEHFRSEDLACSFLESYIWPDKAECPSCGEHQRIGRLNGFTTTIGTWKCYACRKPFSARRNTLFEGSHIPVHVWLQGLYILAGTDFQIGAKRLATILGLSLRSAFLIKQKVQRLANHSTLLPCCGHSQRETAEDEQSKQCAPSGTSTLRFQRFITAIAGFDFQKTEAVFKQIFPQLLVAYEPGTQHASKEYQSDDVTHAPPPA
jgi:transposase-like protein